VPLRPRLRRGFADLVTQGSVAIKRALEGVQSRQPRRPGPGFAARREHQEGGSGVPFLIGKGALVAQEDALRVAFRPLLGRALPAVVTAWLAACSSSNPVSLSYTDNGRTVIVQNGAEINVTLGTIGPGQYANPDISSPAVGFVSVEEVGPYTAGGVNQLFRFHAQGLGQASVSIPHQDPSGRLDGGAPFAFIVDVESSEFNP
jgi:hypothetical protein